MIVDSVRFLSLLANATGVEVFSQSLEKHINYSYLKYIHQIGAVMRSGERRP
ncbi:hypothetical protein [Rhodovulum sp. 12E13]|uniref:hypothetical protein n=1 Tax=Rhodovulum sp. 12E13 TaxID=2203891 RepID=UPI001314D4DD|nr:hypothetical protein [Rhodovulum sp. 12E13]